MPEGQIDSGKHSQVIAWLLLSGNSQRGAKGKTPWEIGAFPVSNIPDEIPHQKAETSDWRVMPANNTMVIRSGYSLMADPLVCGDGLSLRYIASAEFPRHFFIHFPSTFVFRRVP